MKLSTIKQLIREEVKSLLAEEIVPKKIKDLRSLSKYFLSSEVSTISDDIWGKNTTRIVKDKFNKPYWVKYVYKSTYDRYLEFRAAPGHTNESIITEAPLAQEQDNNYMFFQNLKTIHHAVSHLLKMDESAISKLLSDGHGWALDHITTSADDIEEVYHFLTSNLLGDTGNINEGLGAFRRLVVTTKKLGIVKREVESFINRENIKADYPDAKITIKTVVIADRLIVDVEATSGTALASKILDIIKKFDKEATIKVRKEKKLSAVTEATVAPDLFSRHRFIGTVVSNYTLAELVKLFKISEKRGHPDKDKATQVLTRIKFFDSEGDVPMKFPKDKTKDGKTLKNLMDICFGRKTPYSKM